MENKNNCNTCGTEKALPSITCDVKHCVYNGMGCTCHAPSIAVGPCGAECSAETVCTTFRPKDN